MDKKEIRKIWMKDAAEQKYILEGRVKEDIEKYRKGYCKIKLTDEKGMPLAGKKVTITQKEHAFKYGANIFMLDEFPDDRLNQVYRDEFKRYFNLATIPFYWSDLEPEQGKPRFDKNSPKVYRRPAPELCMNYCEESGIEGKLHCLVYDRFVPEWLPLNDMAAMEKAYEERFRQIADRYSGRLMEFEVINEVLCESGWDYKSIISEKRDILEWAFGLARKYFPNETLVLNEYSVLPEVHQMDYRHRYFTMIDATLQRGTPIDKIGVQHHCFTGAMTTTEQEYIDEVMRGSDMFNPEKLLKGLDILSEFGRPLELTEITVPTFGDTCEDEELQADLLEVLYTVGFSHQNVDTMVYWNVPDDYAQNAVGRKWNENLCKGGLFKKDMTPKKSAERLYELFNKRWRTNETLTTDMDGCIELRGFYGKYELEAENAVADFEIVKNESNSMIIQL